MKSCRLVALFTTLAISAFASAPVGLGGQVYSEFVTVVGVGTNRSTTRRDILLQPDGRVVGLLSVSFNFLTGSVPLSEIPANGTWSYRRIDDRTGELTVNGTPKTLTFTGDTSGTIPSPDTFFTTIRFATASYETAAPLINCSNRSFVRGGSSAFTGFVMNSASRSRVLVRAVGPGLGNFGITDPLRHPTLKIVGVGNNTIAGSNDGWDAQSLNGIAAANRLVGAFPLSEKSGDSAVLLSLAPGAYVAEVSSPDPTDSGQVLVEVYLLP